jgi:exopolyphosphatase/guanosine-5'-triphosphate,3'-diphosphate pyrophosphatase
MDPESEPVNPSSAPPEAVRLAAIDVGTNSIRLVVAEVEADGTYRILDEEKEMTRLGQGSYRTGRLTDLAVENSLEVLGRMKTIAEGRGVRELRAIATSAVREASNGSAFCREARRRFGLRIEVVSARDEAELAFRSVAQNFELNGRPLAAVDIGGGSVEVILAVGSVIDQVYSLPLGAVRLTEQCIRSDPPSDRDWKRLRRAIDRVLDDAIRKPPFTAETLFGSGGTFTTLAEIDLAERGGAAGTVHGYPMTRAEVVHLMHLLREAPLEARRQIPGLSPKRADIIVAGAAVVARLARRLGSQQIVINDRGIRDAVLRSLIASRLHRAVPAPPRNRMDAVRAFARKCRSNERHCDHTSHLASQIFDGLEKPFALPPSGREILQAAALLHDIGYLINHSKHHKHAYHLILHSDLSGFPQREIELIANVARYHRRAHPKKSHPNFGRLERDDRWLVRCLAGILRVADGLDRAHTQRVAAVRCHVSPTTVRLTLEAHTEPELEIWDARRKGRLVEKAFDRRLELRWAGAERRAEPAARPSGIRTLRAV